MLPVRTRQKITKFSLKYSLREASDMLSARLRQKIANLNLKRALREASESPAFFGHVLAQSCSDTIRKGRL